MTNKVRKVSCDYDSVQKRMSVSTVVEEKFPFNLSVFEDKQTVHSKLIWVTIRYTFHRDCKTLTSITVGDTLDTIIYDDIIYNDAVDNFDSVLSETVDDAIFAIFEKDDVSDDEVYALAPILYHYIRKVMADEKINLG